MTSLRGLTMLDPNSYTIEHGHPFNGHSHPIGSDKKRDKKDLKRAAIVVSSARELRRREFEPIRYVVPGYIAEGCTLLAGRPKLGKSWLVLEIGLAVSMGGS